jgi:HAD superfamily hydrolase (TIGR01549 family)
MRRFDAVLFDLGGTLIYFRGRWPEVIQQINIEMLRALNTAGFTVPGDRFLSELQDRMKSYDAACGPDFIEVSTAYHLRSLLGEYGYTDISDVSLQEILKARYAVSQSYWEVEEDAHPMLNTLQSQGYRLGIISNAGDDTDVHTLVDKAKLRSYFEIIQTSAARGIRKPNPRIFLDVLEWMGVSPARAVMVGDTLGADILGAKNAGILSVWISRRADVPSNRAHLETIQPDATIQLLSELPGLLSAWESQR